MSPLKARDQAIRRDVGDVGVAGEVPGARAGGCDIATIGAGDFKLAPAAVGCEGEGAGPV